MTIITVVVEVVVVLVAYLAALTALGGLINFSGNPSEPIATSAERSTSPPTATAEQSGNSVATHNAARNDACNTCGSVNCAGCNNHHHHYDDDQP